MSEDAPTDSDPTLPRKYIVEKPHLVDVFRSSQSFTKIVAYIQACAEAVESTPRVPRSAQQLDGLPSTIRFFVSVFFPHLHKIVDKVPLGEMKQQRFGNKAFRAFYKCLHADVDELMRQLVSTFPAPPSGDRSEETKRSLAMELAEYIKDSFGNSTRIDYGTGHELHFFILMIICLEECGDRGGSLHIDPPVILPLEFPMPAPVSASERGSLRQLRQGMVFDVFGAYLKFMRRLQTHYHLEPAGSHGVWGLDDYHHLPFIFGAAQLIGKEDAPRTLDGVLSHEVILPKHVCEESKVRWHADEYLYFAQIAWIRENKSGPFFEHSSMLYNISGVENWKKIYVGMVKMYAAEVLSKFNVVQHLLFGTHLPWGGEAQDSEKNEQQHRHQKTL